MSIRQRVEVTIDHLGQECVCDCFLLVEEWGVCLDVELDEVVQVEGCETGFIMEGRIPDEVRDKIEEKIDAEDYDVKD